MLPLFCKQNNLFLSLPARTIDKTGLSPILTGLFANLKRRGGGGGILHLAISSQMTMITW